jgi:integrase
MPKVKRPYRTGGLYRPTYLGPDGKAHHQQTWWIAYRVGGKLVRESAQTPVKADAERTLRKRLEAAGAGRLGPDAHRTTLATLERIVSDDHAANGRDVKRVTAKFKPLAKFFGATTPARAITTDRLAAYQRKRLEAGAKPATVNRDMAALRRAFRLAARAGRVEAVPHFPMLREDNVRQGFLERDQFEAIRDKAPEWLKPVLTFMYWTGWRRSEVLPLQWRQVDLAAGVVRLEPGTTKNKRGRSLPFHALPELREIFDAQRAFTTKREHARGEIIPHVFHIDGLPLVNEKRQPKLVVYDAWQTACKAAGLPGRLLHDFRRTAVRNLERSGASRSAAMAVTGHLTESVYRRYAIVNERDVAEALAKLAALPKKAAR